MLTLLCATLAFTSCSSPDKSKASGDNQLCAHGGVVGWGDSLTWAYTKIDGVTQEADPTWLGTLGEELGLPTKNLGVPGQGSAEIAVRQGGLKPLVTLRGDQIPRGSTEAIAITAISPNDGWSQARKGKDRTYKMHGALAGVDGTLVHINKQGVPSFAFVPDHAASSAVPVPANSAFSGDDGTDLRTCMQIIWAGTNNLGNPAAIIRDIASMVEWMPHPKRYLVIGTIPNIRDELSNTYGSRFVDLRSWLVADGLAAASLSPSPKDTKAIAVGKVPPSLMVDGTHFTQAAYTAIGHYLASVIKDMG